LEGTKERAMMIQQTHNNEFGRLSISGEFFCNHQGSNCCHRQAGSRLRCGTQRFTRTAFASTYRGCSCGFCVLQAVEGNSWASQIFHVPCQDRWGLRNLWFRRMDCSTVSPKAPSSLTDFLGESIHSNPTFMVK